MEASLVGTVNPRVSVAGGQCDLVEGVCLMTPLVGEQWWFDVLRGHWWFDFPPGGYWWFDFPPGGHWWFDFPPGEHWWFDLPPGGHW